MTTIDDLIAGQQSTIASKLAARAEHTKSIEAIRSKCIGENRDPSDDEAKQVTDLDAKRGAIDTEVDLLKKSLDERKAEKDRDDAATKLAGELRQTGVQSGTEQREQSPATVQREARTYTAASATKDNVSFFGDAFRFQNGQAGSEVRERLERHEREVKVEREMSERATTTSSFAGLVVPQYLVEQAALLQRAGRPFANTVQSLPLPAQGTQFQIPRGTTGAATAIQATENTSVQSTDEVWANVTVPVVTIAGQQDVSRQSLERGTPGIDSIIYMDLAGAYGVNLDQQTLSGSGASGQMLGALNTAGINQATAFTAAATATTFYTKVAGQLSAIETTRFLAPNIIAMHPRRWNWLLAQVDTQGRPLAVPNVSGNMPMNAMGVAGSPIDTPASTAVGYFLGLPVITDASLPTSVGTGPEDQVIIYRASDLLLWEDGDGMPRELRFEQTLGNQLTVKLVVYGYAAFTAGRYPSSVGVVGGNAGAGFGLVAPTF